MLSQSGLYMRKLVFTLWHRVWAGVVIGIKSYKTSDLLKKIKKTPLENTVSIGKFTFFILYANHKGWFIKTLHLRLFMNSLHTQENHSRIPLPAAINLQVACKDRKLSCLSLFKQ